MAEDFSTGFDQSTESSVVYYRDGRVVSKLPEGAKLTAYRSFVGSTDPILELREELASMGKATNGADEDYRTIINLGEKLNGTSFNQLYQSWYPFVKPNNGIGVVATGRKNPSDPRLNDKIIDVHSYLERKLLEDVEAMKANTGITLSEQDLKKYVNTRISTFRVDNGVSRTNGEFILCRDADDNHYLYWRDAHTSNGTFVQFDYDLFGYDKLKNNVPEELLGMTDCDDQTLQQATLIVNDLRRGPLVDPNVFNQPALQPENLAALFLGVSTRPLSKEDLGKQQVKMLMVIEAADRLYGDLLPEVEYDRRNNPGGVEVITEEQFEKYAQSLIKRASLGEKLKIHTKYNDTLLDQDGEYMVAEGTTAIPSARIPHIPLMKLNDMRRNRGNPSASINFGKFVPESKGRRQIGKLIVTNR